MEQDYNPGILPFLKNPALYDWVISCPTDDFNLFLELVRRPHVFKPGQLVITCGARTVMDREGTAYIIPLFRHLSGDWGDVPPEDKAANDQAVKDGSRILSNYTTQKGTRIWIITEAEDDKGVRCATTILLPEEY